MTLAIVPYLASNSTFIGIDFVVSRGFVKLPTQGLVSRSHATSFPFPTLWLGWKVSVVTMPSSSVVSGKPQIMHNVGHMLASYWPRRSYSSVVDPNPRVCRLEGWQSL